MTPEQFVGRLLAPPARQRSKKSGGRVISHVASLDIWCQGRNHFVISISTWDSHAKNARLRIGPET